MLLVASQCPIFTVRGAISKIGDAPLFDGNVNEILLTKGTLLHAR